MEILNTVAVDDEIPALHVIENFCEKLNSIRLLKTFDKTREAAKFLQAHPIDLVFMDIQMPQQNGMELYKSIAQDCMVIFTSAYSEYAVEGFNVNATDYLLKPFSFDRFKEATERAFQQYQLRKQPGLTRSSSIFIRADYNLIKIEIDSILFIEGLDDYLKIHLMTQQPVIARMTMKSILDKLPSEEFCRVHRSYIVSLKKVQQIRNRMVSVGGREIPLGNSYIEAFLQASGLKGI